MLKKIVILITLFSFAFQPQYSFAQDEQGQDMMDQAQPVQDSGGKPSLSQKITMDLKGVDILDVLKILSKRTGLNIVAGKNVGGNVTLYLQNVDVWSALKKILETADLAYIEEDDIIRVMTGKDYEGLFGKPFRDYRKAKVFDLKNAKASELGEIVNQLKSNIGRVIIDERSNSIITIDTQQVLDDIEKTLAQMDTPTESKVYTLHYALAEDLEPKLKAIVNPVTGSLEIDKRSNKIYVRDLADRVKQVTAIVKEFDSQPLQVLIEAKVIEVILNDQSRFGIDWNAILERSPKNPYKFSTPLTVANPSSGPLANVTFATLTGDKTGDAGADDFNFVISALDGVGKTNTLSSPRLTVMNNQEAKLAVATREPFVSQTVVQGANTASTADNVQFVDVGVTLTVKPTIAADDNVMIKIKPAVSTAGTPLELQGVASGSDTAFVRTRVPVVTTQEIETMVIVKSGTTIVMGGLIQDRMDKSFRKIPILGDIPFLGAPFRNKIEDAKKTELVIFITPHILKPNVMTDEPSRFLNEKGDLLDFDKVADVDFVDSYRRSNNPWKRNHRPYWQEQIHKRVKKRDSLTSHPLTWDSLDTAAISEATATAQPVSPAVQAAVSRQVKGPRFARPPARGLEPRTGTVPDAPTMAGASSTVIEPVDEKTSMHETPVAETASLAEKTQAAPAEQQAAQEITPQPAPEPVREETADNSTVQFVPDNQSAAIFQELQRQSNASDPIRVIWRDYFKTIKGQVIQTLENSPTLSEFHGDVRIEFSISKSGKMQSLEVFETRNVNNPGQKMMIAEVLKKGTYAPLPGELGSEKKIRLTVRL